MFAITVLKVLLAIAPLFYHGFGKASPQRVYHDDWRINGRYDRRPSDDYHDPEGWVIIGPRNDRRYGENYHGGRNNIHQDDRKYEYTTRRYVWHSSGNYNDRASGKYDERKYDYNNTNNRPGNSWSNTYWNNYDPYRPVSGNGSVPQKHDWRYFNGSVDDKDLQNVVKKANIQVNPYIVGQSWWSRANSDARWDNETGDLWKDPRGPAANVVTKPPTTTTTLPSNNTAANVTAGSA
ncbi:uncharacterized protein [Palaemon carinicauda]|uniref:uncharacterized protein n=1 Tax=Palaemon carinicauda TaxID=392227 RepID=UPI0035B63BE3